MEEGGGQWNRGYEDERRSVRARKSGDLNHRFRSRQKENGSSGKNEKTFKAPVVCHAAPSYVLYLVL